MEKHKKKNYTHLFALLRCCRAVSFSDNVSEREFAKKCKSETVEVAGEVEVRCPMSSERSEGTANRKKNKNNGLETAGQLDWTNSKRTRFSTNSYRVQYTCMYDVNLLFFHTALLSKFIVVYC